MKTTVKQGRRGHAVQREIEQEQARLRKYLGRLISSGTKPGGPTHDYRPRMTFRAFCVVLKIDAAMVGTPDYMGLAYWWNHDYKHEMRAATTKQRKKAHDAILAAGLPLYAATPEHAQIIAWATNNGQAACKSMGCQWKPYDGPRPSKRRAAR